MYIYIYIVACIVERKAIFLRRVFHYFFLILKDDLVIEGKISQRAEIQPVDSSIYMSLKKSVHKI